MDQILTPNELAVELGKSPKTIRAWLRANGFQSVHGARYQLTPEQADQVRARFRE